MYAAWCNACVRAEQFLRRRTLKNDDRKKIQKEQFGIPVQYSTTHIAPALIRQLPQMIRPMNINSFTSKTTLRLSTPTNSIR